MAPRARLLLLVAVALLLAPRGALGAPILLEDGVAFVTIDPESQDLVSAWTVDGVPHLRTQGFWLRIGPASSETPLSSAPPAAIDATDSNGDGSVDALHLVYRGPNDLYEVQLRYAFSGTAIGAPGLPSSELSLDVTLTALQGALPLSLFQYADVDLFTSYDDDASEGIAGGVAITDMSGLGRYESTWSRSPDVLEVAPYDALLASLNDAFATLLIDHLLMSGDVTFAAQWYETLMPGASISLSQTQTIRVVPESGVALLLALGLAGLAARRKEVGR